jgi:hypothetical protein
MKPVPVRVESQENGNTTAHSSSWQKIDSQGKFVVEEDHNGEL